VKRNSKKNWTFCKTSIQKRHIKQKVHFFNAVQNKNLTNKNSNCILIWKRFLNFLTFFLVHFAFLSAIRKEELRTAVPNLVYAHSEGYVSNLKGYAKSLRLLWKPIKYPNIILLGSTWVFFSLFRGTRTRKGWEPLA